METWWGTLPPAVGMSLGVATAVFLALSIVLLALLTRTRRALDRRGDSVAEWTRVERELTIAEQEGRLRIIGELQGVAVRSVSRLITQVEGAGFVLEGHPATARSLERAVALGKVALGDLRRAATVANEGQPESSPRPGLHSADDLFRVMRDAGLELSLAESGERFALRPAAELAIFRILQGALENSLLHGGAGTSVRIEFVWDADGLRLSLDDDGVRATARRLRESGGDGEADTRYSAEEDLRSFTAELKGAGLAEMRRRAGLFGGVVTARPVPGVGFSLAVAFPALRLHNGVHGVDLGR